MGLGLLLLALALGQTHPCDVTNPTVYREPAAQLTTLRVGFCFAAVDTNNVLITEPVGFSLQLNSGPEIDLGLLVPLVGPNANGEAYYEVSTPALAAGTVTLKAYTALLGMSAPSAPVTLTLLGSPKPPRDTVIIRKGPEE